MVKPRLIFTLLAEHGSFMMSRNFSLQRVGDLTWLREHYDFDAIALSIDELVVLDVTRGRKDLAVFAACVEELSRNCFMPIAAGGGITSMDTAYRIFDSGADKLVVNSAVFNDLPFVMELVRTFGGQSIVVSVDYLPVDGMNRIYVENGSRDTGLSLEAGLARIVDVGVGEIYLNSIQRDGTGQGYDLQVLEQASRHLSMQVVAAGGVGSPDHLLEGLRIGGIHAVATANLFNFMADGLTDARRYLVEQGINLASWDEISYVGA